MVEVVDRGRRNETPQLGNRRVGEVRGPRRRVGVVAQQLDLRAHTHQGAAELVAVPAGAARADRSEEHTSELQSRPHLVCRLLLEKKKKHTKLRVSTAQCYRTLGRQC